MAHRPIPASAGPVQTGLKANQVAVGTSAPCSARKGFPVGRVGNLGRPMSVVSAQHWVSETSPQPRYRSGDTSRPRRRRHNASDITVVQICRQATITRLGRDIARIYYEVNAVFWCDAWK
ncbi:hypothetical protein IG631_17318 [Alternaria alternata]|nr:hypothetical protein IG631_17318 [Alternaria alternata]